MKLAIYLFCLLAALGAAAPRASGQTYKYIRTGEKHDAQTTPIAGTAMMGGGADLDEAFRWLCARSNGGDFLILRAYGDDDYNAYVKGLCKLNSVATLIIPDRESANDPAVVETIRHAEAVFVAGGDQARYVNFWRGTPVQDAINANIAAGKPIGGTSAGLAILGEFSYGALLDRKNSKDLSSAETLINPFHKRVTIVRDFLKAPHLQNTITDSHFVKRDRLGRSLVFLARLMQDGWATTPREIAIDEKSAVLVDEDGIATVIGTGSGVYFLRPSKAPDVCQKKKPLTFFDIAVYHAPSGARFDIDRWTGEGGAGYSLNVAKGIVQSTQTGGAVY